MRNARLSLALLLAAVPAFAQGPPAAGHAAVDGSAMTQPSTLPDASESVWLRGEYLLWITTTRRGLESAQETTSNPLVNTLLTSTNTTDQDLIQAGVDGKRGYRLTAGTWLDSSNRYGIEASAMWLNRDALGTPAAPAALLATAIPGLTGAGGGGTFAIPLGIAGVAGATLQLDLGDQDIFNYEVVGRAGLYESDSCRLDALLGARCLTFEESLAHSARIALPGVGVLARTGIDTRSTYLGGVIGLDGEVSCGSWFVGARPRATIACIENEVTRQATVRATLPALGSLAFDSGVLGDIAQRSRSWTVLPELDLRAGKQFGNCVRVMIGASALMMPDVARASGQLNPGLPIGGLVPGAGLVLPPQHETMYLFTMSAGLEVRF